MSALEFSQLLGNYGEFVGAIAIVVTLIYLAVQLKQNTEMIRLQVSQSRSDAAQSDQQAIFNSDYMPKIRVKATSDQQLTEEEMIRYGAWLRSFHRNQDNVIRQYNEGYLGSDVTRSSRSALQGVVGTSRPAAELWELTKSQYSDDYIAFVEESLSDQR